MKLKKKNILTNIDAVGNLMNHFTRGERLDLLASFIIKQFKKGKPRVYRQALYAIHDNLWDMPLSKKDCLKLAKLTNSNYIKLSGDEVNKNQPTHVFSQIS